MTSSSTQHATFMERLLGSLPNSAGLRSSRTIGVWHKPLKENQSARIKERSLLDHIMSSEEPPQKIQDSDIFRILQSETMT